MLLIPNHEGLQDRFFECLARRRLTATAVAIRLYETDHGQLPQTLDELVPQYLPRIPENPLLGDGSPICYDPHPQSPQLYTPPAAPVAPGGKPAATQRLYLKGRPSAPPTSRTATRPAE